MNITIQINTDNSAFEDGNTAYELSEILEKATNRIMEDVEKYGSCEFSLFESNGNRCGTVTVTESEFMTCPGGCKKDKIINFPTESEV